MTAEADASTRRPPAEDHGAPPVAGPPSSRGRLVHFGTVMVLLIGLVITSVLSFGAQSLHNENEDRLLHQRVREVATVVTAAIPALQTPLASAAVLAEATDADPAAFRQLIAPLVSSNRTFVSASLWSARGATPSGPLVVVGARPELQSEAPQAIQRVLQQASGRGSLTINNLLAARERRLGYAYEVADPTARFVVYAEIALPKDRRAKIDRDSAFSDLGYALYLGDSRDPRSLLASSSGGAILQGRRASVTVPFGDTKLLLDMTADKELGGALLARLPWALAVLGLLLTLAAASLVERLFRRRDHAESLASENAHLYTEQRTVAQTLQHSLLPDTLPRVPGLELATRYVAGVEGIDIGGDWYDVMVLDDGLLLFVVGDVSGRGLRAATTMAELRYAIRAYGAQGDPPAVILAKTSRLIDVGRDGHFATVLCGTIDVPGHRITLANAGHPEPLLVAGKEAWYATTRIGVPVGVANSRPYTEATLSIPENATFIAYTDGLVERRGELLDIGLERLRHSALLHSNGSVEDLLTSILSETISAQATDDTAILGLRWTN